MGHKGHLPENREEAVIGASRRPYPRMKDSGVPSLGLVPEHWTVQQLGKIGQLFKGNGGSKREEVSSGVPCVRYGDLYTRHEFFIHASRAFVAPDRSSAYTPIHYGDLLFAASGETVEDIGRSAINLIEGDARCGGDVLVLRPSVEVNPWFLGFAADSHGARHQKAMMARGFTIVHIYGSQLKQLALPFPPLSEQSAIVRYLDHADRRIRRYIRAKQKLIRLLEEQKQASIHRAVTRGLDPNVRLRPSGLEWVGDVPEHWEVVELRRLTRAATTITYGIVQAGPDVEGGVPYIRTSDMRGEALPQSGYLRTSAEIDNSYRRSKVEPDDLVVAIRATLGKGLLVPHYLSGANLTQGTARVSPGARLLPRFLLHAFNSYCQEDIKRWAKGTTFLEITLAALRRVRLAVPPLIEQQKIVEHIERSTEVGPAIECARSEIALLREYRIRLIADVVTGKLDVREAAAGLPKVGLEAEELGDALELEVEGEEVEYGEGEDEGLLEVAEGNI